MTALCKKTFVALTVLMVIATGSFAREPQRVYIPLATSVNSERPSHLLTDAETSFAENVIFERGDIKKRQGTTVVKTFDGEILGYHDATSDYAIIAAHNGGTPGGVVLWEWNREPPPNAEFVNLNTTHMTKTSWEFFDTYGGGHSAETAGLYHPTAKWRFVNHIDPVVGTVTVGTNGEDAPIIYVHKDQSYSDIYAGHPERHVDFLYSVSPTWVETAPSTASMVKGKYLASFYNALYLANITSDGSGVLSITNTTGVNDPTAVIWSDINDATDFSVAEYFQQRPEGGSPITGLIEFKDNLILTKSDQVWAIAAYANHQRLTTLMGATTSEGIISYDSVYLNDQGRVLELFSQNHLSFPIHTSFASQEAGTWDLHAATNKYAREFAYSAGRRLYTYRQENQGWQVFQFADDIDILDYNPPGGAFKDWIGTMDLHTSMTIREEDTLSDFVLKYGTDGDKLAIMNHFTFDNATGGSGENIDIAYTTKQEPCGSIKTKSTFLKVIVQGLPNMGPMMIEGFFTDSPRKSFNWETLGTITTDSEGFGELWIDKKRNIWASLRVSESSKKDFRISEIGLDCEPARSDR